METQAQKISPLATDEKFPVKQKFEPLPFAAIKPAGWMKENLSQNLRGFTGQLDVLVPELFEQDDIYGQHRLNKNIKNKNLGALSADGEWQAQFLWWNSETQSNWLDGYIKTAILLNDSNHLKKAATLIQRLLATQDADGYLGIYEKDLRYQFNNENGELWSKATLYRALLAWYDYTKDPSLLHKMEAAVGDVMTHYPVGKSHPFYSVNPDAGGLTHGLAFTDVLEKMYSITKSQKYLDYCFFLYRDFSEQVLNEDAQYPKLLDASIPLKGHSVHTYEHLRSLAAAYYASDIPVLKTALDNFLTKIDAATTPSGAGIGDEFIAGRKADASTTGYEYCSLQELMAGWISLMEKTGQTIYADKAEHIFLNAAMGATNPTESAICYLKTDNAYILTGGKNGDTTDPHQTRYRYSPVHKEAAVCCVPNAGRIGPYFIEHMWLQDKEGPTAMLLGPSVVTTSFEDTRITINEETRFPFDQSFRFVLSVSKPTLFAIKIRKPSWVQSVEASMPYTEKDGFLVFKNTWKQKDVIAIQFITSTKMITLPNREVYFQNGPLVLCHPVEGKKTITKTFPVGGLSEFNYKPIAPIIYQYNGEMPIQVKDNELQFITKMINPLTGKSESILLIPMFQSILRQVSFPIQQ